MALEEARKRTEASLARKRAMANANAASTTAATSGGDLPISSGAMDSLLEKLRAAAPQARDQRDRRRRARLKERHQVRVASGQKIPDNLTVKNPEDGDKANFEGKDGDVPNPDLLEPHSEEPEAKAAGKESQVSEGEDVADRAASMLQGLRNSTEVNGERSRRRRESAEEERRNRRLRRRNGAGSGGKGNASLPKEPDSPTKTEVTEPDDPSLPSTRAEECLPQPPMTPSIVVSETTDSPGSPPEREPADEASPDKPAEPSE